MPWSPAGTLVVNLNNRSLQAFPTLNLKKNKGFFFYLTANPTSALIDYGYLLVIPRITLGGVVCERPRSTKWFPKGVPFTFKVSLPEKFDDLIPVSICLYPIRLFSQVITPPTISVGLFFDLSAEEDAYIEV